MSSSASASARRERVQDPGRTGGMSARERLPRGTALECGHALGLAIIGTHAVESGRAWCFGCEDYVRLVPPRMPGGAP